MDKPNFAHDPRAIARVLYNGAKSYWVFVLMLKLTAVVFGIVFVLKGYSSLNGAYIAAALATCSELCQWRSDVLKGQAEGLQRKIDHFDSLGWPISGKDMSDQLTKLPAKSQKSIAQAVKENYWASQASIGASRAVENLQESAWWSAKLANAMALMCSLVVSALFMTSFIILFVSIASVHDLKALQSVSRVAVSVLSIVTSLGLLKIGIGYHNFCMKAEQVEQNACNLAKSETLKESDAIRLLHEYQISRSSAPLIPNLVWSKKQDNLNALWKQYRAVITTEPCPTPMEEATI